MHELESYKEPLLVVSHQATLRVLYTYLVGGERRDAPKVEIPLHTLIKITWDGWRSIREERIAMEDFTVACKMTGRRTAVVPRRAFVCNRSPSLRVASMACYWFNPGLAQYRPGVARG